MRAVDKEARAVAESVAVANRSSARDTSDLSSAELPPPSPASSSFARDSHAESSGGSASDTKSRAPRLPLLTGAD